ncbi:MAG: T9SS type A sorting domain-containing protein [Flavobacteriaceae bacterium]|nr:T9SS type A sorting domain-containing protein [Flavobacteriaceae bacterium]
MNKKILLYSVLTLIGGSLSAQQFSDDFEAYTNGDYIAQKNTKWTTWKNQPGTQEDVKVTKAKAHSGSLAAFFSSSVSNGGPQDLVLPFGQTHNTGKFWLEMWMWVDKDSSAYMNVQGTQPMGSEYAINIYLNKDRTTECRSASGDVHLKTTYPQNQWFSYKLDIDLNTNTWELLIDGVSKGKFASNINQINSLDLYPLNGSSFYIDDVKFDHTPYTKQALNVAVTGIMGMSGYLAGQQAMPSVIVRNLGTTAISSYQVEIDYNGNKTSQTVSFVNIPSLGYDTLDFTSPIILAPGIHNLTATLKKVNAVNPDDDASDDSKVLILDPVSPAANKAVVAEEGTGTWCGWCPRGAVFMDKLHDKYGDLFIPIAIHNGASDPMVYQPYDSLFGKLISGYPTALVDRGTDVDPSAMEVDFLNRIVVPPSATIVNGAIYDATTNTLKVSLTTKFLKATTGDYRIACVITEDSIHSTNAAYKQANYYSGGNSGVMGGFEVLPNPVPAAKMWYSHVARYISPNFGGQANSFPSTINENDQFTHNIIYPLDPKWKSGQIRIVGMLIDPNGKIDNANSTTITQAVSNGFVIGTTVSMGLKKAVIESCRLSVFPNPTSGEAQLGTTISQKGEVRLEIYSITGRLVSTKNYGQIEAGEYTIPVNCNGLSKGIYICKLSHSGSFETVKLVID